MEAAFQSGFASALLDVLFSTATGILIVELRKVLGCDAALDNLETTILEAHNLLRKLDAAEMEGNTKIVVAKRVDVLTGLFYDAEDLMGDIVALMENNSCSTNNSMVNVIVKTINWTKPREIGNLQTKMDDILTQLKTLDGLTKEPESGDAESSYRSLQNSTIPLIGREGDVEKILDHLLSDCSESDGVSILGMDGLGKTSLAQTILKKATNHFSASLWVDVPGGHFNYKGVDELGKIQSCGNKNVPSQGDSSILIIFDNLLKVALNWCDMVSDIRNSGINGKSYTKIRFIITTFRPEVAELTRTRKHYLKPLSNDDCEKVIIATIKSLNGDLFGSPCTNKVVQTLAKNSGGLPSVAHRLGQFLRQFGEKHVQDILRGDLWDSSDFKDHIFPPLKSWYSKFNSNLKRYLAYFSLFPHDCHYAFTIDDLVHLWVGEGFIQHPEGISKMIEIGKKHFHILLGMTTLQLPPNTPNGMQTYELNHFSNKFAQLAASRIFLRLAEDVHISATKTRHLSLCYTNDCSPNWKVLKKLKVLRTLFALFQKNIGEIPIDAFKNLTRLRVLSLSGSDVCKLPDSIKCLERLSYLNISRTPIKTLPSKLFELTTLQFLKLTKGDDTRLEHLPEQFEKLTNMIEIDWDISDIRFWGLPSEIGKLSSLQTLPLFPVQNKDGHCITELKDMNHLQGSILITNLEYVKDGFTAIKVELDKKLFDKVELEWGMSITKNEAKHVLTGLKPNACLKQLKITNYSGDEFPNWMVRSLSELEELQLEELHLENCPTVQSLPINGYLPSLKFLFLEELRNVVNLDHHFFGQGSFPKLESLSITFMEQLQEWNVGPDSKVIMPGLKALQFSTCPKLVSLSSLEHYSSLKKLKILRCGAMSSLPLLPSSLEELIIEESDSLEDRCTKGGEDWTKFDHVPDVQVGFRKIRSRGITASNYPNQIVSHTS